MPTLVQTTPEGVTLRREIVGAGSRLAAGLFDAMIVATAYAAVALLAMVVAEVDPTGLGPLLLGLLVGGLPPLVFVAYFAVLHGLWNGQTPGKRVLGIRVVSADGFGAGWLQYLLRSILWPFEALLFVPVSLGILVMLLTERNQRLGDLVAGTLVVREDFLVSSMEPFPDRTWSGLEARTLALSPALAARLDERDFELVREVLSRRGLQPDARRRLFVSTARHYAKLLDVETFQDARVFLMELFLYLRETRRERAF